jgi:hypothetical protein
MDALWLFGNDRHADAQVVIVEEQGAPGDGQAATGSEQQLAPSHGGGSRPEQANPACGSNDGQADAGNGQEAKPAPKRGRDDDTQAAVDKNTQPEPAAKRSRAGSSSEETVVLPLHKAVVMSASEFFKARLDGDAWQSTNDDGEPCRVVLHVPPGQAELGRRFVRALYEDAPSFDDLGLEQTVQLLRLADRYGAPRVVKAAAAAAGIDVALMSKRGLASAAVQAAYSSAGPPAAALRQYAADALQELFGDLEAVWASPHYRVKRSNLLLLPHAALKALLADERTRVASENTVVHTIVRWVAESPFTSSGAEAKELLALVRVARLTPHYARTVFCESALAKAHLSAGELALAAMAPLVGDESVNGLRNHAHWRLPARPRSALADSVVLEWSPPLAELEELVIALPALGEGSSALDGPKGTVWQGWPLHLWMQCRRSASAGVTVGVYLTVELPCSAAGALIENTLEAVAAGGGSAITRTGTPCLHSALSKSWGYTDLFSLGISSSGGGAGPPKDWAGVEAALRAQRLVHGEGGAAHLMLRCALMRLE